jgi:oligopeptide transport system ATP-binding protein
VAALLEVENLKTEFRTHDGVVKAVDGVSFKLDPGETLGVVGESGCGKSMTALSIMRLIPDPPGEIVEGNVLFEGRDLLKLSNDEMRHIRGNQIGMIFQDPMTSLNPVLTIERQMTEGLELHQRLHHKEATKRAIQVLGAAGIPNPERRVTQYPHQFSGGMRQRVMIAMAISCRPKLLIADEPTTALDVTIQAQILELLKDLQKEHQMALILITHALGVVAGMTDRIIVMYAGHIVEAASTEDLFEYPQHPYTLGLLKSIPRLDAERKTRLDPIRGAPPDLIDAPAGCPFAERCDYTTSRCDEQLPTLVKVGEEHEVACWHVCGRG